MVSRKHVSGLNLTNRSSFFTCGLWRTAPAGEQRTFDKSTVRRILSDMSTTILTTRVFTKQFASHKRHAVQVADRGRIIGTWTPAGTEPPFVDFEARALRDWGGKKLPVTAAQILKEGKRR
jgi:hypothetical protein